MRKKSISSKKARTRIGQPLLKGKGWLVMFPALEISIGKSKLRGLSARVLFPKSFSNKFKKGDKVIRLHLETKNAKETIALFRELEKNQKKLMEKGFKGVYGDTPNTTIKRFLRKKGWVSMPSPLLSSMLTKFGYAITPSMPKKHLKNKSTRLIKQFDS